MAVEPPRWTAEQLDDARMAAIARFREQRMQEPLEQYLEAFDEYRTAVEELLEATVDLTRLDESSIEVLTAPALVEALRYLAGPPLSADDLKTLAEASLAPSRLKSDPEMAKRVVDTVLMGLDRRRFPWVAEDREPDEREREAAALASAALLAHQRVSTNRRNEGKDEQEAAVELALTDAALGDHVFKKVPTRTVKVLSEAPGRGEFCRESMFGGRKADFIIGLWDGRAMALECKVSNSSTNSVKRLNNDAGAKATVWLREFGTAQTVPAAMLSGVFKRHNLQDAQNQGLTLFWAHRLTDFTDWLTSTAAP
jgi:hypothetical protein